MKWLSLALVVMLAAASGCQETHPNENESEEIARTFLSSSATYSFDGMDNIELIDTIQFGYHDWGFIYEFDCVHPGYGDRTGFPDIPKEITRHTAVVPVVNGKVNSPFLDEQWDMKRQAYVSTDDQQRR